MSKDIDLFSMEKPKSFKDLLAQVEFISNDMKKWLNQLISTTKIAQKNIEIISEGDVKDTFHNLSQNLIDLSELIQKKLRGE